jgi:hypothetical protein
VRVVPEGIGLLRVSERARFPRTLHRLTRNRILEVNLDSRLAEVARFIALHIGKNEQYVCSRSYRPAGQICPSPTDQC